MKFLLCLLLALNVCGHFSSCLSSHLSAAEIALAPANGQPYDAAGSRFIGAPVNVVVILASPATVTVPPSNTANIGIFSGTTFDTLARVVSTESIAEIAGSGQTQWLYTVTPTKDGPATLIVKQGTFGLGLPSSDTTFALILDRKPIVLIPAPGTTLGSLVFTSTITDGLASTEIPVFNNSFLNISNGALAGTPVKVGNVNTITVASYGYGVITLTAIPGYVSDQYANQNVETIATGTFSPPGGTTFVAPKVVSISGLSPGNRVYRTNEIINLAVNFDRSVSLAGTAGIPYLKLNSTGSGTPAYALYTGVSGNSLLFSYTITAGQAAPILDLIDSSGLVLISQTALVGTANIPDFVAVTTVATPGATGSLSATTTYAINVDPPKPLPEDVSGASPPGNCGAGSGLAVVLLGIAGALTRLFRGSKACR